jgi:histidinol-phosphatase
MAPALSIADGSRLLAAALDACRAAGEIQRRHFRSPSLAVERKGDASPVTVADRDSESAIREVLRRAAPELGCLGEEMGASGDERDRWIVDPLDATKNFVAGLPYFAILIGLELDGELVLGVVHAPALGPGAGLAAAPSPSSATAPAAALGETWWAIRGSGAFAGTGTLPETAGARRLAVSRTARLEQAFVLHGGLKQFQRKGLWDGLGRVAERAYRTRGFGDWWGHVLVAEGRCDAMIEAQVAFHDVAAIRPLVEEAGGRFLTRGGIPLAPGFDEPVLSAAPEVAEELAALLGF